MKKVFFLTNNNYHEIDMVKHLDALKSYEINLIRVPHTLEDKYVEGVENTWTFVSPFVKGFVKGGLNVYSVFRIHAEVRKSLRVSSLDVLLLYTEFEPLNQYVAKLFKDAGARVYVLDEGLGTYLTYSQSSDAALPIKYQLKLWWFKYILGYKWMKILFYNHLEFPQMLDSFIDGVMLYRLVNIVRDMPAILIEKEVVCKKELCSSTCVFINSDMYNHYCSWSVYEKEIIDIMSNLIKKFDVVYFKFHPRETFEKREGIKKILAGSPEVSFVENNAPIEDCIGDLKAKYAVSYLSTSLLTLMDYGVNPVYIFDCMGSSKDLPVAKSLKFILSSIGIELPTSLEKVTSSENNFKNNQAQSVKLVDFLTLRQDVKR